jgi:hypothetical protein
MSPQVRLFFFFFFFSTTYYEFLQAYITIPAARTRQHPHRLPPHNPTTPPHLPDRLPRHQPTPSTHSLTTSLTGCHVTRTVHDSRARDSSPGFIHQEWLETRLEPLAAPGGKFGLSRVVTRAKYLNGSAQDASDASRVLGKFFFSIYFFFDPTNLFF